MNAITQTPVHTNRLEAIIDQQGRELNKPLRALVTETAHTAISALVLVRTAVDTGSVIMAGNYVETVISTRDDIELAQHTSTVAKLKRELEIANLRNELANATHQTQEVL